MEKTIESSCGTDIQTFKFKWVIKHLAFFHEKTLTSPTFSSNFPLIGDKWHMKLEWAKMYPFCTEDYTECLKLTLWLLPVKKKENKLYARARFTILRFGSINRIMNFNNEASIISRLPGTLPILVKTWSTNMLKESVLDPSNGYLIDNNLNITCEMEIDGSHPMLMGDKFEIPENRFINDMLSMLENGKFGDFTIKVGNKSFTVHKGILAERSAFFAALFEHDFRENKNNLVDLTDISEEVCKEMLHFIYTGEAPNIAAMPIELFIAADKYQLDRLKMMCKRELGKNITVENAVQTYTIACTYDSLELKKISQNIIKNNFNEILHTKGFKELRASDPNKCLEMIDLASEKL